MEEIEKKYYWKSWSDGSEEEEAIAEILSEVEQDEDFMWEDYLEKHLKFPFKAIVTEGSLDDGTIINVLKFESTDEYYDIIFKGKIGRKTVYYPLCDVKVKDKKSANYIPVKAFGLWYTNRRY